MAGIKPVLYLNHSGAMSGAEASLLGLLRALGTEESGIQPTVGLPDPSPFGEVLRQFGVPVRALDLRRVRRPRNPGDAWQIWRYLRRTVPHIEAIIRSTDCSIVHSNTTTAHLIGGLAARKCGVPNVWHVRDLVSLAGMGPWLASKSDKVIAISQCVAANLRAAGVPENKIQVIYNGLDLKEWRPRAESRLREQLGLASSQVLVGMVGQLVPWKNHLAFIEMARQVVRAESGLPVHFAIIGGDLWGEESIYVNDLKVKVEALGLKEQISFVPHQHDSIDTMAALDVLVHPATDEPFGRVLIEAMALEKTVIGMNANGPAEIIQNRHNGLLVTPGNSGGLSTAVLEVVASAELRREFGAEARWTAERRFNITEHVLQIQELYRTLLDGT